MNRWLDAIACGVGYAGIAVLLTDGGIPPNRLHFWLLLMCIAALHMWTAVYYYTKD